MDELTFELEFNEDNQEGKEAVKKAKQKRVVAKFEPTWEQVWDGYEKPNAKGGTTRKKGIYELKNTESEIKWLEEVKEAIEEGELSLTSPLTKEPIPMSKVSKSSLKELYAVLEKKKRVDRMKQIVKEMPSNYFCITETEQMEKLVKWLEDEEETGLDSETTGLDVYVDKMVGISITLPKKDIHVYIPFGHVTGEKQLPRDYVLDKLKSYLFDPNHKKFLHNAKFDRHMFMRHDSNIFGRIHDTQIAMKLLNENEPSNRLKDLLTKYKHFLGFTEDSWTFDQLFGKNARFDEVPLDIATAYACKDTHGCYLLGKWQEKFLKENEGLSRIFYEIESPLLPVVVDMERKGLLIDLEFGESYGIELSGYLEELEKEIRTELGDINLNSPQQLAQKLYDELGLEDISGKRSTDKKTLEALSLECEVLGTLLSYKDLFKLNSTYISALPQKIKSDGRIHGQFNQDKTDTGRFSSQEPNLQNLPSRARKMFVAPKGKIIVGIDFSQIEPRVLSHITGDEELMRPYKEGFDLYSTLASKTFKVPIEQCGDGSKYRKMMKTGLLAVMYGTSMFTLSRQLKISVQEAEQFIEDFYKAYPRVKEWIESIWEFVKENEFVSTMYGRKRRFPYHKEKAVVYDSLKAKICKLLETKAVPQDFWNKKKYPQLPYPLKKQFQSVKGSVERVRRQSVNAIIQGSSADIMKIAMLNVDEYLKEQGWSMIATVHDELLMEVDETITHDQLTELYRRMAECVELDVPIKCDVDVQRVWSESFKFNVNEKTFMCTNDKTGEVFFKEPNLIKGFEKFEEVDQ